MHFAMIVKALVRLVKDRNFSVTVSITRRDPIHNATVEDATDSL